MRGHIDDVFQCNPGDLPSSNDQFLASSIQVTNLNDAGSKYKQQSSDCSDEEQNQLETHAIVSNRSFPCDTTSEAFVLVTKGTTEPRTIDGM